MLPSTKMKLSIVYPESNNFVICAIKKNVWLFAKSELKINIQVWTYVKQKVIL